MLAVQAVCGGEIRLAHAVAAGDPGESVALPHLIPDDRDPLVGREGGVPLLEGLLRAAREPYLVVALSRGGGTADEMRVQIDYVVL